MDRRFFLKGAAFVTIMVKNGEMWRAFGQEAPEYGEGPAYEPWKTWREDAKDGPLLLVRSAILCSNAYNSQPWLFKVSKSSIELYADIQRNIGAFDPYLREMHFSLGCALENLMLAAASSGYKASVSFLPAKLEPASSKPEPRLVARIELAPGKPAPNELFDAIPHRHTNREAYDRQRPIPPEFLSELGRVTANEKDVKLFLFSADADRKKLADMILKASGEFLADSDVRQGTQRWFRTTLEDVQKYRDGVNLVPGGNSRPATPESYLTLMLTGKLFGLIAVRDRYDRVQTIRAGRIWQRTHLLATARRLATRPANGAVEIIDHQRRLNQEPTWAAQLGQMTGDATWQPTFMFYMGYPTLPAVASPRRAMNDVLA